MQLAMPPPRWRARPPSLVLVLAVSLALTVTFALLLPCAAAMSSADVDATRVVGSALNSDKVKAMFQHGYDSYMRYAYPRDELSPLSCTGRDTWGSYALTLVDTLDALVVFRNASEFANAVTRVVHDVSLDQDQNTSVFETTIRILGGLLSAHLLAVDPTLGMTPPGYRDELLHKAVDVAERLLPAFDTATGMPYGTVNLRNGVPRGETTVTTVACAGTLLLEFGVLSELTDDPTYIIVAEAAMEAVWDLRSERNLLGTHVDAQSGKWVAPGSTIAGGADSFFEYLLKAMVLFNDTYYGDIFAEAYMAVESTLRQGPWHVTAHLSTGQLSGVVFESLQAFWPGLQILLGDVEPALESMEAYVRLLGRVGFLPPERIDVATLSSSGSAALYPLRPEFAESVLFMYQMTRDDAWREIGKVIVDTLDLVCRVECGFAAVADIHSRELYDSMDSFFLAETLKYLYMLFDTDNPIASGNYIFTTEAHPLPVDPRKRPRSQHGPFAERVPRNDDRHTHLYRACDQPAAASSPSPSPALGPALDRPTLLPYCPVVHHRFGYSLSGVWVPPHPPMCLNFAVHHLTSTVHV